MADEQQNINFVPMNNQWSHVENQASRLQPTAPQVFGSLPPIQNENIDPNKEAPPPSYKDLFG